MAERKLVFGWPSRLVALIAALHIPFVGFVGLGPSVAYADDVAQTDPVFVPIPCRDNEEKLYGEKLPDGCNVGLPTCDSVMQGLLEELEIRKTGKIDYLKQGKDAEMMIFGKDRTPPPVDAAPGTSVGKQICDISEDCNAQSGWMKLFFGCGGDSEDFEKICYDMREGGKEAAWIRGLYVKSFENEYEDLKERLQAEGGITLSFPHCTEFGKEMLEVFNDFGKQAKDLATNHPEFCQENTTLLTTCQAADGSFNDVPNMAGCYLNAAALIIGAGQGSSYLDLLSCEWEANAQKYFQTYFAANSEVIMRDMKLEMMTCRNLAENECSGVTDDDEDCARDRLRECWRGEYDAKYGFKALLKDLYYDHYFSRQWIKDGKPEFHRKNKIDDTACGLLGCFLNSILDALVNIAFVYFTFGAGLAVLGAKWALTGDPWLDFTPGTSDDVGYSPDEEVCLDDRGIFMQGDNFVNCCSKTAFIGEGKAACPGAPVESTLAGITNGQIALGRATELLQQAAKYNGGDTVDKDDDGLAASGNAAQGAVNAAGAVDKKGNNSDESGSGDVGGVGGLKLGPGGGGRGKGGGGAGGGGGFSLGGGGGSSGGGNGSGDEEKVADPNAEQMAAGALEAKYEGGGGGGGRGGRRGAGAGGNAPITDVRPPADFGARAGGDGTSVAAMGSEDPENYFGMIDPALSIFKVVEKRYRLKSEGWAWEDIDKTERLLKKPSKPN